MPLTSLLIALYVIAALFVLAMLAQLGAVRARWRERRHLAAGHRLLWALLCLSTGLLTALLATALLGYRRLSAETPIARLQAQQLGAQRFAIVLTTADGTRLPFELNGDQWQLDARVIKWTAGAVIGGAPPLYQLDRISGRYIDVSREREAGKSAFALSTPQPFDLWHLKRQFPRYLPWIDADFGSSAYLPLVDGGAYDVTLAAAGGLIARPADAATATALHATAWPPP